MNVKKKNALFGTYPACDRLNRALRSLRGGDIDSAVEDIIRAIYDAGGYFYEDNAEFVTSLNLDN